MGQVVQDAAGDTIKNMAKAIADAVGQTVKTLGTFWVNVGTPNLTSSPGGSDPSDPVAFLQNSLWFWTAALAVLSVLVGAAKMIIERRGAPLRDLGRSLATLVVISGAGVGAVGLLTVSADKFSVWIIENSTGQSFNENITAMLAITAESPLGSIMIILLGLIAILASVIQIVLMIVRGGLLVVLTGIFPTAAAFTNTEAGKGWFQKCTAWLIAFILYKPAAAIVYATAFKLVGTNVFGNVGDGKTFGAALLSAVTGLALMVVALFALPALMRFVTPMVGAVAGGGGALAAGAVGGLASGAINMGSAGRGGGGSSGSVPSGGSSESSGSSGPSGTGSQGDAGSSGTAGKTSGSGTSGSAPSASGAEASSAGSAGGGAAAASGGAAAGGAAAGGGPAAAGGGAAAGGAAAAAGPAGVAVIAAQKGIEAGQAATGAAKQMSEESTGGA